MLGHEDHALPNIAGPHIHTVSCSLLDSELKSSSSRAILTNASSCLLLTDILSCLLLPIQC